MKYIFVGICIDFYLFIYTNIIYLIYIIFVLYNDKYAKIKLYLKIDCVKSLLLNILRMLFIDEIQ